MNNVPIGLTIKIGAMKKQRTSFIIPGLDQKKFAELLGVSAWQLSQWKQGNRLLPVHAGEKLAGLLQSLDLPALSSSRQELPMHPDTAARLEKWQADENRKQEQNKRKIRILQAQLDKMKEKHRQILYVLQKAEQYLSVDQEATVSTSSKADRHLWHEIRISCLKKLRSCDELEQVKMEGVIGRLGG